MRDRLAGRYLRWLPSLCMALLLMALTSSTLCADSPGVKPLVIMEAFRNAGLEPDASGEAVPLPDSWNPAGRSGVWTYVIPIRLDVSPNAPWSVYVPRVGNRFTVHLNGRLVAQQGRLDDDSTDYVQHPQLIRLAAGDLTAGTNQLTFTVAGELSRYAGLSRIEIGPTDQLEKTHFQREIAQNWGAFAVVVLAVLLATVAGSVAWFLRDKALTLFTLASVFTAVRNLYSVVTTPPVDYQIWSWLTDVSYGAVVICLVLFSMTVVQLPRRWLMPLLGLFAIATLILVSIYAFGRLAAARQAWLTMQLTVALLANALLLRAWWQQRTRAATILGVAALVAVAFGAYDHVTVFYLSDGYSSFALSRYALPLFTVAMAAVLIDRFGQYALRERELRIGLADELTSRTQQLETQFRKHKEVVHRLAQVQEREKLVQDLHDGMGMQLHGLLNMVEQGDTTPGELTSEVRTAIEQLRTLVDSAEPFDGDLSQLFGHIRHRIEVRLRRAGIELQWNTHIPQIDRLIEPTKASALQQVLFELVTNSLKHSRARVITIEAQINDRSDQLIVEYADDGVGFDVMSAPRGGGTRSMLRRLADLNATHHVHSAHGKGSHVGMSVPLAKLFADAVP